MIDLAHHYGTDRKKVSYQDIKAVIEKDKVDVRKGDLVLFHTGYGQMLMDAKGEPTKELLFGTGCVLDGRDQELLDWVTESGIVALISDNYAVEVGFLAGGAFLTIWLLTLGFVPFQAFPEPNPPADPTKPFAALGLHEHCLFKLGCYLGEIW